MIKHTMFESVRLQLQALLRGFYEVVPAYLVSVFDFQELELLLCGLPQIDIEDWKKHMRYRGEYNANHRVSSGRGLPSHDENEDEARRRRWWWWWWWWGMGERHIVDVLS
jgi:hypothetical protein